MDAHSLAAEPSTAGGELPAANVPAVCIVGNNHTVSYDDEAILHLNAAPPRPFACDDWRPHRIAAVSQRLR